MKAKVNINNIYAASEDVVARSVQGEFLIIPIASGIGDLEDEIFTLNEAGKAVWDNLDGKKALKDVIKDLKADFKAGPKEIEGDVKGIAAELLKRRMIVEVKK